MIAKGSAMLALLLLAAQGIGTARAQANVPARPAAQFTPNPATSKPIAASAPRIPAATQGSKPPSTLGTRPSAGTVVTSDANAAPNCEEGPCDAQPAHITVATPAPVVSPSLWQERVLWVASLANIMLAVFGYVGIMLALSALKKIEHQSHYAEAAAEAAADSARASLLHAQAIVRAERPWVLISAEPSRSVENGFTVTATNRGRGPARIVSTIDTMTTAVDQNHLPDIPDFGDIAPSTVLSSVVLLPGESTGIKSFGRDEVKAFCGSDESFRRVEKWEELILLYGKVVYKDLIAVGEGEMHETSWCCWYIHGRQKSGMVMAGPPAYNTHS